MRTYDPHCPSGSTHIADFAIQLFPPPGCGSAAAVPGCGQKKRRKKRKKAGKNLRNDQDSSGTGTLCFHISFTVSTFNITCCAMPLRAVPRRNTYAPRHLSSTWPRRRGAHLKLGPRRVSRNTVKAGEAPRFRELKRKQTEGGEIRRKEKC